MATARPGEAYSDVTASVVSAVAVNVGGGDQLYSRCSRALYVGGAGNVVVVMIGDSAPVTLVGLATGVWHPMQIQQVNQSGTTATGIILGF